MPFIIAFAVSVLASSVADRVASDFGINRKFAACFAVFVFYCIAAGFVFLLGLGLYVALKELIFCLPSLYENSIAPAFASVMAFLHQFLHRTAPELSTSLTEIASGFTANLGRTISDFSVDILCRISGCIAEIPYFAASAFISVVATFFITLDYKNVCAFILRQIPPKWHIYLKDIRQCGLASIGKYIKSYTLIAAITFCELVVALWLLGVDNFVIISLVIAVFDIFPVCGSGGILIPWSAFSLIQGKLSFGTGMLVVYTIITVIRQIIEPRIVGQQTGISPVATLIAMFSGARFMGISGLFIFPISLVILKNLNDSGHIRLFK